MSGSATPQRHRRDGKIIGLEADISSLMASAMGVKLRVANMPFRNCFRRFRMGKST